MSAVSAQWSVTKSDFLEQLVERDKRHAHLRGKRLVLILVVRQNLHVEPARPLRDFLADAAKPDDAQGGVVNVPPKEQRWPPSPPVAGTDIVDASTMRRSAVISSAQAICAVFRQDAG